MRFFFGSIAPKLTWMLIIKNDDRLRYGSCFGNVDATTMRTFSLVSHKSSRELKKTDLHRIKENQSCFVKRETFSGLNEPMPIGVTICLSSDYGNREGRKTNIWPPSKCAQDCVKFVSDVFLRLSNFGSRLAFVSKQISVQAGSIHNEVQIDNRFTSKTLKSSAFVLDQTSSNNVTSNTDTRWRNSSSCTFFSVSSNKSHSTEKLVKFNGDVCPVYLKQTNLS